MDIYTNLDFEVVLRIIDRRFNDFIFNGSYKLDNRDFLLIQRFKSDIKEDIYMEVYKNNGMC